MTRRFLFSTLAFLIFMVASTASAKGLETRVGDQVPEFSLSGLDGRPVSFRKDIRGKAPITVIFFMTTACSACFEEIREIHDFASKYPGKVEAWAVAVDLRGAQTVGPYQQSNRFRVKYLLDPKFTLPRVFGFHYTPSLVVVDADGVILHKKGGYAPNERVSEVLRTFLR
jgi:peroxiredoxin